ncbi:MAG: CDP-alcohol phosphatidyltransferase family protein [Ferrimicrobium sp.]
MSRATNLTYGPTAIATPANAITVVRIALTPILVIVLLGDPRSLVPLAIWAILAVSDGADGYVARRQGTTRSGAFLDPLADKILVFAAFIGLIVLHRIDVLPVLVMGVREVVVSVYRTRVLAAGKSLPARMPGKLKMVMQIIVVGAALIPGFTPSYITAINVGAWIATVLALVAAVQYFVDSRSVQA